MAFVEFRDDIKHEDEDFLVELCLVSLSLSIVVRTYNRTHPTPLLTHAQVQANAAVLLDELEYRLEPENLTCDGELSRREVGKKADDIARGIAYLTPHIPSTQTK